MSLIIGVTGANGFIGNHLLRSLLKKGFKKPRAFFQGGTRVKHLGSVLNDVEAYWGDLSEPATFDGFLKGCDAVIHLAGYNRYWSADPSVFMEVNLHGARNLALGCLKHRVGRLVHVSSCITLGASDAPVARDEKAPFNLHDIGFLYAQSKKAGEDQMKQLAASRGLPVVIVNPASAIGELDHGPTPIGKPIADIARGLWPMYVAGGACFIDVQDVVRGLWLALERGKVGEQYLLAGENLSNREFMSLVARCAGRSPPRFKVPKPLLSILAAADEWAADHVTRKDPTLTVGMSALIGRYLYFSGAKAEAELGFKAAPVATAIGRAVEWFRGARESEAA